MVLSLIDLKNNIIKHLKCTLQIFVTPLHVTPGGGIHHNTNMKFQILTVL